VDLHCLDAARLSFGASGHYTTLAASPVTEEAPVLQADRTGNYCVLVPAVQHDSSAAVTVAGYL
jgi:hypothetical protein